MKFKQSNMVHFVAVAERKDSGLVVNKDIMKGVSVSSTCSSSTVTFDAECPEPIDQDMIDRLQKQYLEMNNNMSKCLIMSWQRYEEREKGNDKTE